MKKLMMFCTIVMQLWSQSAVEIRGLRIFANEDEYQPPVIVKNGFITIEFDVVTPLPPDLQMVFYHASRDWVIDENLFVNDPIKMKTDYLSYSSASHGVNTYTYRFRNSFPNSRNLVEFIHSGNYIVKIVDRDSRNEVLAEGKFIVAENIVPSSMTIENRLLPESSSPFNQVNYIAVDVTVPGDYRPDDPQSVQHTDVTDVDIIQNWKITEPYRIDADVRDPDTFVEHFYAPSKQFWIRNIPTGNEYRRLDLSNATTYPNSQIAVQRDGPDVSRFQWQGKPDANGASKLRPFTGPNSNYLEVEMNLRLPDVPSKRIFVVGGFTDWEVKPEYEMKIDSLTKLFRIHHWVRRGVYDYQYVLGNVQNGKVVDQDWISLEGNDWRTINRYIALVYYRDRRFGGFDRIVGMIQGKSPGGDNGKKVSYPQQSRPVRPNPSTGKPR